MYRVLVNGHEKEFKAAAASLENGYLLFYKDSDQTEVVGFVMAGRWDALEVLEGGKVLKINRVTAAPAEKAEGECCGEKCDAGKD